MLKLQSQTKIYHQLPVGLSRQLHFRGSSLILVLVCHYYFRAHRHLTIKHTKRSKENKKLERPYLSNKFLQSSRVPWKRSLPSAINNTELNSLKRSNDGWWTEHITILPPIDNVFKAPITSNALYASKPVVGSSQINIFGFDNNYNWNIIWLFINTQTWLRRNHIFNYTYRGS